MVPERWRFLDNASPSDEVHRRETLASIDSWWREFARRTDDLVALFKRKQQWDLPEWMGAHLQSIHPELMWEFGRALRQDGHRLVVTPEAAQHLRPLVQTILARAPDLPGWEFYDYRVPEGVDDAVQTVHARTGGDIAGTVVRVRRQENNLISLVFSSPKTVGPDDDQARRDAFVAAETLLGERILDRWIGTIDVEHASATRRAFARWFGAKAVTADSVAVELDGMSAAVNELVERIRATLPSEPHFRWVANASWSLLEVKPLDVSDDLEQRDICIAKTANLDQWKAAHSPDSFYGERFSRCDETFAYVKLDGVEVEGCKFADKGEIEDALEAVLVPTGLGCTIGGGTGLRYSYVDVALTDVDAGLAAICACLREGYVSRRSWVQFFEATWKHEWVGVYPDSPRPPMPQGRS